jgi:hypothetical protein
MGPRGGARLGSGRPARSSGQDVGTPETEDQEYLDRPATDAPDPRQALHDLLLAHPPESSQGRNRAVVDLGPQILERRDLVERQASRPRRVVRLPENLIV